MIEKIFDWIKRAIAGIGYCIGMVVLIFAFKVLSAFALFVMVWTITKIFGVK
jgi:hypothetical protein